ncbi:MAG: hypothetical protein M3Y91_07560 [Actinomycetota bacterium]|nr:hypothetical protein [Actinomycetota bacterium]
MSQPSSPDGIPRHAYDAPSFRVRPNFDHWNRIDEAVASLVEAAYKDVVRRGIEQLIRAIPAEDLAIQWDVCYEVLDLEGVLAWTAAGAWERFIGPTSRLSPLVPEDVLLGYHFCYGTFREWPMFEARDMDLIVITNAAVEVSGRPVDWFQLAGPRVFLGIVLPLNGIDGLRTAGNGSAPPPRLRHLDVLRLRPPARPGPGGDPARTRRGRGTFARG